MAYAVENSAVIVCFLTEKYECSVNCKRELSYADRMGIVIIPLIVERYRENGETFSPCGNFELSSYKDCEINGTTTFDPLTFDPPTFG